MRIFTRYMAKRFFKPFFYGLAVFALLIFLGDLFNRMNYLVKSKAGFGVILQYLWLEVPYWSVRVIPMATLLATLIAMTGFIQSGEWIGAQAAGFKTSDFWRPVLWCSLAVTVLSFAAQETVLPICFRRAEALWRDRIHPEWEWDKYYDVVLIGRPNEFLQAKVFLPKEGRLERPTLEAVGPGGIERQLDAQFALWDGISRRWVFHKGFERKPAGSGGFSEEAFERKETDLDIPPKNLVPRSKNPDEMSLREIRRYAERARHLGIDPRELAVAAHGKIAYPFTNFVLCALGIPIALRLRQAAKALSFFSALAVSFVYLWCMEMGRVLGLGGRVPPFVAAWLANVLFGAAAAALIKRYDV